MTSLNKTYRNSRTHTSLAAILATVSLGAVIYLGVQVNGLNQKYGLIANDIEAFEEQRQYLLSEKTQLMTESAKLRAEIGILTNASVQVSSEKDAAVVERDAAQLKMQELAPLLGQAEKTIQDAASAAVDLGGFERQIRERRNEIAELEQKQKSIEDIVANLGSNRGSLNAQIEQLKNDREEIQQVISQRSNEMRDLQNKHDGLATDVDKLEFRAAELVDIELKISEATLEFDGVKRQLAVVNEQLVASNKGLKDSEAKVEASLQQRSEIEVTIVGLTIEKNQLLAERDLLSGEVATLNERLNLKNGLAEEIANLNGSLQDLARQREVELSNLAAKRQEIDGLNREIVDQTELRDLLSSKIVNKQEVIALIETQERRLSGLNQALAAVETQIRDNKTEVENGRVILMELEPEIAEIERMVAQKVNLESEIQDLDAQKTTLNLEVMKLEEKQLALVPAVDELSARAEKLTADLFAQRLSLGSEIEVLRITISEMEREAAGLEGIQLRKSNLMSEIANLENNKTNLGSELQSLEVTQAALAPIVEELRLKADELLAEIEARTLQRGGISNPSSDQQAQ